MKTILAGLVAIIAGCATAKPSEEHPACPSIPAFGSHRSPYQNFFDAECSLQIAEREMISAMFSRDRWPKRTRLYATWDRVFRDVEFASERTYEDYCREYSRLTDHDRKLLGLQHPKPLRRVLEASPMTIRFEEVRNCE